MTIKIICPQCKKCCGEIIDSDGSSYIYVSTEIPIMPDNSIKYINTRYICKRCKQEFYLLISYNNE